MKPRLLDLFCGAGGAAMGYSRAGFEVVGVDIKPQPRYPFAFYEGDAMDVLAGMGAWTFDAVHASPPCQAYSATRSLHHAEYPALVESVRAVLLRWGMPYVIENVVGAPLCNAVQLCGSSFGLGVRRHRLFEVSPLPGFAPPCAHYLQPEPLDVTGTGGPAQRHRKPSSVAQAQRAMGIDWMTRNELNAAVPPAYTQFVGERLIEHLARVA